MKLSLSILIWRKHLSSEQYQVTPPATSVSEENVENFVGNGMQSQVRTRDLENSRVIQLWE
eukprot:1836140-Amphidinium_carterae.1